MRYWFDLLTPKQVLFFHPVIRNLRMDGHEVLATARRFREVEELAAMRGLDLYFVGSRGGKDPLDQLNHSLDRMKDLLPRVVEFAPDAAVSVASVDCARIAFGLRIRHIAVNDSPHSVVAGKLSLPLSYHLVAPWIVPYPAWLRFGVVKSQITRYRALDPAAWLKGRPRRNSHPKRKGSKATILVRLEESYAPYLVGSDESWSERILVQLARDFAGYNLVVLCRYPSQLEMVKKKFGSYFEVPGEAVDGAELIERSDAFVGMGGTMTTEAALLGVPSISAFQGDELYTERYLASKRLLVKARSPAEVSKCVRMALKPGYAEGCRTRARALLDWMEDPAEKVSGYLEELRPAG